MSGPELFGLLVPIRPEHELELRHAVEALPADDRSPFSAVPGTHVARLVIIRAMGARNAPRRRLHPSLLSFSGLVDGPLNDWLLTMCRSLGATGDALWNCCSGWPGPGPAATALWLRRFRIRLHTSIVGNTGASVDEVEAALRTRSSLLDLAVAAPGLTPGELRDRYRSTLLSGEVLRR